MKPDSQPCRTAVSYTHLDVYKRQVAKSQWENAELAGCYNVGPDDCDCVNTGRLADLFCETWGGGMHWINRYDGGPHEANFLKLDCSKVKKVFGWKPHFHVEEAMAATVEWSKKWLAGADMREVTDCLLYTSRCV